VFWGGFSEKRRRSIKLKCLSQNIQVVDYFSTPMAYLTKSMLSGIKSSVRAMRLSISDKFSIFLTQEGIKIYVIFSRFFFICAKNFDEVTRYFAFPYSLDGWSAEGCHAVKSTSNADETECSCNHLTHFAVLFDYSDANSKVSLKSLVDL